MKEFLTDTLELDRFLEYDLFLKNEHILKAGVRSTKKNKFSKPTFLAKEKKIKDLNDFSSLERIRIIVESLSDGVRIEDVCHKEGITEKTYLEWKKDFLEAFKAYSEDVLIKEKFNLTLKELVLRDSNLDAFNFFKNYIDIYSGTNLVIPKGEKLSTYSNFKSIKN